MQKLKELWKQNVANALGSMGLKLPSDGITVEIPPQPEMGDLGFPMFGYAKLLKKAPAHIAEQVAAIINSDEVTAVGPYLNVMLNRPAYAQTLLAGITEDSFFKPELLNGLRYMVEFSSPNTNKPLHLGHLRNDVLGESISRILAACGAEVRKVCIINDRGVHICKSMLAYKEQGTGETPERNGVKSDHFVGDFYVRFHQLAQEDPQAEERAQALLRAWEAGDTDTVALWKRMNEWAISGIEETYRRTGISFDQYYFESQTYRKGKEEILRGLEQGIFYREADGSVWIDLSAEKLDKKALLRKDGTSLYITQDIGTAIFRYADWAFDRLIYVVGSEQQYHFKVLFAILEKLGFPWAHYLYHLSYGMVHLPEGKMKSREGTVVDADDLIDHLAQLALQEIKAKNREDSLDNPTVTAEHIALGALHYYLLQVSPTKDILFDPHESLSFTGNTGPYLQYMGARISSMIRKIGTLPSGTGSTLTGDIEWELLKQASYYPQLLAEAARTFDPSLITVYVHTFSQLFSRFYHECPILKEQNQACAADRLALSRAALHILKHALSLICVPFLEVM
ncbi:putative arginyl-tRNA synthetase [Pillotina sp. SPG140]|jgi:arginyl-tRNA synthetase